MPSNFSSCKLFWHLQAMWLIPILDTFESPALPSCHSYVCYLGDLGAVGVEISAIWVGTESQQFKRCPQEHSRTGATSHPKPRSLAANASTTYLHNGPRPDHNTNLFGLPRLVVVYCYLISGREGIACWQDCEIYGCIFCHSRRTICILPSSRLIHQNN